MKNQKIQYCNGCGKTIKKAGDMYQEGVFLAEQEWGYFSGKDGERHSFCLCEECYDRMIRAFVIPVKTEEYL